MESDYLCDPVQYSTVYITFELKKSSVSKHMQIRCKGMYLEFLFSVQRPAEREGDDPVWRV